VSARGVCEAASVRLCARGRLEGVRRWDTELRPARATEFEGARIRVLAPAACAPSDKTLEHDGARRERSEC